MAPFSLMSTLRLVNAAKKTSSWPGVESNLLLMLHIVVDMHIFHQADGGLQEILSWLSRAEDRLQKMLPPAAEVRSVRIQLEELKVNNLWFDNSFDSLVTVL